MHKLLLTVFLLVLNILPALGQGYSFNEYYAPEAYGPGNEEGFPQNWVTGLDQYNIIHVGSGSGLMSYNGIDWIHNHVGEKGRAFSIFRSSRNVLYVAGSTNFGKIVSDSLNRIQYESISDQYYGTNERHPVVWKIHESEGVIYFSHLRGIARYNPTDQTYRDYPLEENYLSRTSFKMGSVIYKDGDSGLWAFQDSAYTLVPGSDMFKEQDLQFALELTKGNYLLGSTNTGIPYTDSQLWLFDGQSITSYQTPVGPFLTDNFLFDAIRIDEHTLAIATIYGGVVFINEEGEIQRILNERTGLHTNSVYDLFLDHERNLWMGLSEGLQKLQINPYILDYQEWSGIEGLVTDIALTDEDLYLYAFPYVYRRILMLPENVYAFEKINNTDGLSNLISWGEKVYFYGDKGIQRLYEGDTLKTLYDGPVIEVVDGHDSSGRLTFIGQNKVISVDADEGITIRPISLEYDIGYAAWFQDAVYMTLGNKSGASGVGRLGENGIVPIPVEYDTSSVFNFTRLGILNDKLYAAGEGGGTNSGLYEYYPDSGSFRKSDFMAQDPDFQNKQVYNFKQCSDTEIWFTVNKKTIKVHNTDGEWKSQKEPYHQLNKNANYSIECAKSGIWLGSSNKVTYVSNQDWEYRMPFKTNITGVYIRRDSLIFGGYGVPRQLKQLPYSDNELRFRYAAASYLSPKDNEYKVKLEGFDENWSDWNMESQKDYTNIPEGRYTFRVRSRNVYDVEGEEVSFRFEIFPPWYRTWWAYLLYLFTLSGLLYLAYRIRINQLLRVQRIRNNIASDLHDEVSATLSSISYFAQAIKSDKLKGDKNRFVDLIAKSAGDAKENITDIVWAINPEHDNWQTFLAKCRRFASDLLESKEMKYSLKIDENIPGKLDMQLRQHLWLIFKEMITNSVRHSGASQLDVIFNYEEGKLKLVVQDNGNGMDVDKIEKGNGLVNIHSRADKIGAQITLKTSKGFGTRWNLIIPV